MRLQNRMSGSGIPGPNFMPVDNVSPFSITSIEDPTVAFEQVDPDELEFKDKKTKSEPKTEKLEPPSTEAINNVGDLDTEQASQRTVETADDYKAVAGKPRIYEVIVETVDYNKSGRKIRYSHTIKYPGWEEFFADEA